MPGNNRNIPSDLIEHLHDKATVDESAQLPNHLVQLPGNRWMIWRWIGLRSAGFPVQNVLKLSHPECAAAADQYIEAQDAARQAQDQALEALREAQAQSGPEQHVTWRKAIQQLKKGRAPLAPVAEEAQASVNAYRAACTRAEAASEGFQQAFQAAITQAVQVIYAMAWDDHFREAILWQNRRALRTGVDVLLRKSPDSTARSSQQRQHEALIVSYLQRYCVKNDTIGFFGPVGWARVVDDGPAIRLRPGPSLVDSRTVYFEGWCIDLLAETLAQDEALSPWFIPRRMPQMHVKGTMLHIPLTAPVQLPLAHAAVLRACDGERTAKHIAAELVRNPTVSLHSEEDVYKILKELCARRRIEWTLEIPVEGLHPERSLRQRLEQIQDQTRRQAALDVLDELDTARQAVAQAVGDVKQLDRAFDHLEATFTRLTGSAPTRRAGKTYAGRTLVYEDCRRDVEVHCGPDLLAELGPPLSLILTSARWFTFQAAQIYRQAFKEIYAQLVQKAGSRTIDFANLWLWVYPLIFGEQPQPLDTLKGMLQERWAAVLAVPPGARRIEYTSADLRPGVLEAFAAPHGIGPFTGYHSPDVMIAASSPQDIQAGRYHFVLGEVHPGTNTLRTALFVAQHPCPSELAQNCELDRPEPQVVLVSSREGGGPTPRLTNALVSPKDWRLISALDSCGVPASRALPIGTFVVEAADDTLIVRTRDGRLRFEIIEFLSDPLTIQGQQHFNLFSPSDHTPRISIDRLVISRETWRFTPDGIPFARDEGEQERFLNARRWKRTHDMPRFVFVRTPTEKKPFYTDLASPISIMLFAKAVRRAVERKGAEALITVTEMLPDPSQTWLVDSEGQRYTSELRIAAVDKPDEN